MPDPRTPAVRVERLLRSSAATPSPYRVEVRVVADPRGRLRPQTIITTGPVLAMAADGSAFTTGPTTYRVTNPEKLRNLLARSRGILTPIPAAALAAQPARLPWQTKEPAR